MDLGKLLVTSNCFLVPLGGVDLILGIAWLQTRGEVQVNWVTMQTTLEYRGSSITLAGNPSYTRQVLLQLNYKN